MLTKKDIINKAHALGFEDIGFTTAEPFVTQKEILQERQQEYAWLPGRGMDMQAGTDPKTILPGAKTIVVLIDVYSREAFPAQMEAHFGRCYLDDDRKTQDRSVRRLKAFREFLRAAGVDSKVPAHLPHRLAAARAGLGTFGKNCLFYSRREALGASLVTPLPVLIDREFSPDPPTVTTGCPDWCRNACVAACPTRALKGNGRIDPRQCISFLSYHGEGLTPLEVREPMGLWVYGCDRCQNVCPRNTPWLARPRPMNAKVAGMEEDFALPWLLHMDEEYFTTRIQPHMFYMSAKDLWRWKMNVARVMGNSRDRRYIPDLARALRENPDERVRAMAAWGLGRIGGSEARAALAGHGAGEENEVVRVELRRALARAGTDSPVP